MTIKDIRPPEDIQLLENYLATDSDDVSNAANGDIAEGRHRHQRRYHVEPVDLRRQPAEFVLVDVTERKKAETALRISEDRYRDLVDNSHELICTHDLEGRVLSVNPWAARVLGYRKTRSSA